MELIPTRRADEVPAALDPRCTAIKLRYGNISQWVGRWSPTKLQAIHDNIGRCVEAGVPSLVMAIKAYGKESITDQIAVFCNAAICAMGETNADPNDAAFIASAICDSDEARTLNFAYVLNFFHELKQGKWNVYGGKPHQFMRAFNEYCQQARRLQVEASDRIERDAKRKADAEHARSAMNFDEYRKAKGLGDDIKNPLDILGL